MKKIAFFDAKPYDKIYFEKHKEFYSMDIKYIEYKLNSDTAYLAKGCDGVCAFVNDDIDEDTIHALKNLNINIVALRCAGFNNVDLKAAKDNVRIVRVPRYSPYAIAEHTMALLLTLVRKIHRSYNRTRDYNFSLYRLIGFDLKGKTIGIVGTGQIGKVFINICKGFGMNIIAYDPYPDKSLDVTYADFDTICKECDIISLHCPLTKENFHLIDKRNLPKMKDGVIILNTSRGALIDGEDLLNALRERKVGGAGLDVYEEETDFFYEDYSYKIINDQVLSGLISMPNVIITSHQAFLTHEALESIALTTLSNLKDFFDGKELINEVK
ncbi:MAG: 2-hydroxyacid dehydrogenase [Ruminococcaceae bacterium]|nr:2-hydroxyacid dehydrogenase [Oscillospiraceae bacterium]